MDGRVTSQDGTLIAYDQAGDGPAVVLVGGGATDRSGRSRSRLRRPRT